MHINLLAELIEDCLKFTHMLSLVDDVLNLTQSVLGLLTSQQQSLIKHIMF
jgi:hypothetical protein